MAWLILPLAVVAVLPWAHCFLVGLITPLERMWTDAEFRGLWGDE